MPVSAIAWLISALAVKTATSAYDLGGPCEDNAAHGPWDELEEAEAREDWPKVVELQKILVRQMCDYDRRWLDLADALLRVGRVDDALLIVGEVRGRGTELTDENIEQEKAWTSYVHSEEFKATPLGQSFAQ